MTRDNRIATAQIIVDWLRETRGDKEAELWVWNLTPMPCGLPTDSQLEDGLRIAAGEVPIGVLLEESEREMLKGLDKVRNRE